MGDNETAATVVTNEENEVLEPKTPTADTQKKHVKIDEEIKQLDDQSGGVLLDENVRNDSKNLSGITDAQIENKSEVEEKQSEIGAKRECDSSEITPSATNSEIKAADISKHSLNSEGKVLEERIKSASSIKSNLSNSAGQDDPSTTDLPGKPRTIKNITRHQSDILPSLKQIPRDEDPSMMLFSHKGLPAKSYFKRRDPNSPHQPMENDEKDILPKLGRTKKVELTPKISQIVPKTESERSMSANALSDRNPNVPTNTSAGISRNVLTGRGINSIDEFKTKSARRKDGNPLLGIGYDEPVIPNNTGRVPPGGFSNGLW